MATKPKTAAAPVNKKALVNVTVLTPIRHNGETYSAGEEVSMARGDADAFVALGWAEPGEAEEAQ